MVARGWRSAWCNWTNLHFTSIERDMQYGKNFQKRSSTNYNEYFSNYLVFCLQHFYYSAEHQILVYSLIEYRIVLIVKFYYSVIRSILAKTCLNRWSWKICMQIGTLRNAEISTSFLRIFQNFPMWIMKCSKISYFINSEKILKIFSDFIRISSDIIEILVR